MILDNEKNSSDDDSNGSDSDKEEELVLKRSKLEENSTVTVPQTPFGSKVICL